jgi:ATP-dependent Lon protease
MGRKVIIPIDRNTFVQATGASETELLGDVKHDPYGGHPEIGVKPYKRVIPGAVHEAHEGVLFIDEISSLGRLQRSILTAMQDKKFAIIGRNATSSGASVKVDGVPCDFILVAALNFGDMETILPPLRSRILGNGYEVLLNTLMPDTPQNVKKIVQFIAQEIVKDGRIPHADRTAIARILEETRRRAKELDGKTGLTLRLRNLSGVIKLAGDMTILENSKIITKKHVEMAIEKAKTIEQQAQGRYGSLWRTTSSDYSTKPAEDYTI